MIPSTYASRENITGWHPLHVYVEMVWGSHAQLRYPTRGSLISLCVFSFNGLRIPRSGRSSCAYSGVPILLIQAQSDKVSKLTMSTALAPTRFWGVVALAPNSLLQPAGRICGGTSLPFLRLSPPFQIANALGLIYHSIRLSFAMNIQYPTAVRVVVRRAGLYQHVSEPERRSFFRAGVFVFGALPTLIKAVATQGDRVSLLLALGYFVPFVILELIERVGERATLGRFDEARHPMPAKTDQAVITFGMMAALFALVLHINFCLETLNWALRKAMFRAEPFHQNRFLTKSSPLVASIGPTSLKIFELAPKDRRSVMVGTTLGVGILLLLLMSIQEFIHVWGRWSELATTVSAIAVAITSTLAHSFVYLRSTSTTLNQFFRGEKRHKQIFMEQWIALWTVSCIFLYYAYLYDAAGTYKPAWTEWLP